MTLWQRPEPLVLASGSVIRRTLLEAAGIPLEVHPAAVDERALEAQATDRSPGAIARLLAQAKADAVAPAFAGRVVLAADQTLGFEGRIFSKPPDRAAARSQLRALSGRVHELHAAIALRAPGASFTHVAVARLHVRPLSDEFLDAYLDACGAAALTSVGGYQLEGLGVHLFERVEGDYFTILGLPLLPLLEHLRHVGLVAR